MFDYLTELSGDGVTLRRLDDMKELHFQGDAATIILNDIDTIGLEATCLTYFNELEG
tara:strand:- start:1471 stop:1641 length:171 start_codon:yes stop_codon:yes gene_type:complete